MELAVAQLELLPAGSAHAGAPAEERDGWPRSVPGSGVPTATADRYIDETVEILADQVPALHDAPAAVKPWEHVIVDGTLIPPDRVAADEPYYSQKHKAARHECAGHRHRQRHTSVVSRALPGRTRDLTAARAHGIVQGDDASAGTGFQAGHGA